MKLFIGFVAFIIVWSLLLIGCSSQQLREGNFYYVAVYHYDNKTISLVEVSNVFESDFSADLVEKLVDRMLPPGDLEFSLKYSKDNISAEAFRESTIDNWTRMGHNVSEFYFRLDR